jgi:hypothetical protein
MLAILGEHLLNTKYFPFFMNRMHQKAANNKV